MIRWIKKAEKKTPQIAVVTVALPLKTDVRRQEWHDSFGSTASFRARCSHVRYSLDRYQIAASREPTRRAKGRLTLGKKSHLVAALVQAGALLINHIAPGNRTLAPSA